MQNMHLFSVTMLLVPSLPDPFSQLKFFCNTTETRANDTEAQAAILFGVTISKDSKMPILPQGNRI
ncbi:hypothetical protein Krac_4047 [Ktedonobacter racemifer DSM 44963]|uniref:Uncharacterized protein n=1 Tax=Ktedonobacter racemifer DSM 44963 TaxID=485913 RepID=D6TXS1_KTERA|nr:hypothetical protein Krac_4047 [Ktedonobacter racemifer DSM 44963]